MFASQFIRDRYFVELVKVRVSTESVPYTCMKSFFIYNNIFSKLYKETYDLYDHNFMKILFKNAFTVFHAVL